MNDHWIIEQYRVGLGTIVQSKRGEYKTSPPEIRGLVAKCQASTPVSVAAPWCPDFTSSSTSSSPRKNVSRFLQFAAFGRCGRDLPTSAHRPRLATEGLLKRARGVLSGSAKRSGAWMVPRVKWTAGSAPVGESCGRVLTFSRQARPCKIPTNERVSGGLK